jgi:hypothetical protein
MMSVSGIAGAAGQVQIPIAIKENTPSEERNETQAQKAAEQLKTTTANSVPSMNGIGQSVDVEA